MVEAIHQLLEIGELIGRKLRAGPFRSPELDRFEEHLVVGDQRHIWIAVHEQEIGLGPLFQQFGRIAEKLGGLDASRSAARSTPGERDTDDNCHDDRRPFHGIPHL
jgi:hypothetical protein